MEMTVACAKSASVSEEIDKAQNSLKKKREMLLSN